MKSDKRKAKKRRKGSSFEGATIDLANRPEQPYQISVRTALAADGQVFTDAAGRLRIAAARAEPSAKKAADDVTSDIVERVYQEMQGGDFWASNASKEFKAALRKALLEPLLDAAVKLDARYRSLFAPEDLALSGEIGQDQSKASRAEQGQVDWGKTIRKLLSESRPDYDSIRSALADISDDFRAALGKVLQAPLNARLREIPKSTYEDKKALARFANAELRRFGLAIRCPKTHEPAILQAYPGNDADVGRFRLDVNDSAGNHRMTISWADLPELDLMPDRLTRVPYGQRSPRGR